MLWEIKSLLSSRLSDTQVSLLNSSQIERSQYTTMPTLSVSSLYSVLTTIVITASTTEPIFASHFNLKAAKRGSPCLFTSKINPTAVVN